MTFTSMRPAIFCACAVAWTSAFANGAPLISSYLEANKEATTFNDREMKQIATMRRSRGVRSLCVVSIDRNAFHGNFLTIRLPSGEVLAFSKSKEEYSDPVKARPPNPDDMLYVWTGASPGGGTAIFSISVRGTSLFGTIEDDRHRRFNIASINARNQYLVEIDAAAAGLTLDDAPEQATR